MGSGGRATKTRGMPPDDNTAADPSGATWVVWLVLVGPSLLLVTLACVRRVAPGEIVLVVRRGTVVRSRRSGMLTRWPVVERFEPVGAGPQVLPLVVRARTRDDVEVVVLADLVLEVRDGVPGAAYVPVGDVARTAEETFGALVETLAVPVLVEELETVEPDVLAEVRRALPDGTRAHALEVTRVEALLAPRREP